MPIYDYRCSECGQTSELLVRTSTVPVCPACGSQRLDKQVSAIARQARTPEIVSRARAQAAKEGHFSNYNSAERRRIHSR